MGLRVLVTGGRTFYSKIRVFEVLDEIHVSRPIDVIIHGGAAGADQLGSLWAKKRGIHPIEYTALWGFLGDAAGAERNGFMLKDSRADLVVAFPGARGTADMILQAREAGVPVEVYE